MTCGDGSQGCLGHGDWNMCVKPKLIEKLLSVDVSGVSCGPHHVVVVGGDGEVYSWGCGVGGRLGNGKEDNCCSPTQVIFPNDERILSSFCGYDGSMFITERGSLLACGLNNYNKLGLNEHRGFLMQMKQFIAKTEVAKQCVPTKLGWLRQKVISVSMGAMHTAILVEPGKIITFGCNKSGQLGRGNIRNFSSPSVVKSLGDRTITMIQCGDTFTIAGTSENTVYFWGSRQVLLQPQLREIDVMNSNSKKAHRLKERRESNDSVSDISETSVSEVIKIGMSNSPLMAEIERIGPDSPIIQVKTPDVPFDQSPASSISSHRSSSYSEDGRVSLHESASVRRDIILHPKEILALYASSAQIARGEMVSLSNLFCFGSQVFLVVDTTAPLPRSQSKSGKASETYENAVQHLPNGKEAKLPIPEEDSFGPIPDWLRNELANAVSSKMYAKNTSKPNIGNVEGSHSKNVLQNKSTFNDPNTHYSRFKSHKQDTGVIVQNTGAGKMLTCEEINNQNLNYIHSSPEYNNREKELQIEILKLKEELKKYKDTSNENFTENYKDRPNSKRSFWSRSESSKSKTRSKICTVQ